MTIIGLEWDWDDENSGCGFDVESPWFLVPLCILAVVVAVLVACLSVNLRQSSKAGCLSANRPYFYR